MVNATHATAVAIMIATISFGAIFHAQIADLKNRLAAAHSHIDTLAEHITEMRQQQNRQPQSHAHVPASARRLSKSEKTTFDLENYVRKLKSLSRPAGVDLKNNNSFVLFGDPVDYVLSRTDENLMVAGKQFFVQGEFKTSGPIELPYYTSAVLQATRKACDEGDPSADAIACSLLSYSKVVEVNKALKAVTADLLKFKADQAKTDKLTKDECMKYTDLRKGQLEKYADKSAGEKADRAEKAAKSFVNETKDILKEFARREAADKSSAVEKTAKKDTENALAKANAYTDIHTDSLHILLASLNSTSSGSKLLAAEKAIDESLLHAKAYTDEKIVDAKKYADSAANKQAAATLGEAKKYSDAMKPKLEAFATQEAKTKADAAEKAAKEAISLAKEALTASTKKYTDDTASKKATEAEGKAKKYTDDTKKTMETFATDKAGDAKKHADTVAAQALTNANKEAKRLADAAATEKAAAAQAAAKKHTDTVDLRVTVVKADLARNYTSLTAKVTQVQAQAKAYTDRGTEATKAYALATAFPIGSLYITYDAREPQTLFPGTTWERVAGGRTLVGVVPSSDKGYYGGYNLKQAGKSLPKTWRSTFNQSLSVGQMPAHRHDNVWRWACDPTLRSQNSREGCKEHKDQKMISYIGKAADSRAMGFLSSAMSEELTWRMTGSKIWRERHSVHTDFNGATTGNGEPVSVDIMQPFVTVHIWRRIK